MIQNTNNNTNHSSNNNTAPPENIFRDSSLRYMGYANEVGESFRYHLPRLVRPTYVIAFGYCAADALTSGHNKWNEEEGTLMTSSQQPEASKRMEDPNSEFPSSRQRNTAIATFDTLLWQLFASVLIPGGTINLVVRTANFAMTRTTFHAMPVILKKWFPTMSGLGSIPFIVHPIDSFVDLVMDHTTRKWIQPTV